MKRAFFIAAVIAGLGVQSVSAMPHCGNREDVAKALHDKYDETHRASGLQSNTGLLEVWASESFGSWTILMTRPDGQTCIVASGTHWLERDFDKSATGAPA